MRRSLSLLIAATVLVGCGQPMKTYQEACFQDATPQRTLFGPKYAPRFDPVLTVQQRDQNTFVYCTGE